MLPFYQFSFTHFIISLVLIIYRFSYDSYSSILFCLLFINSLYTIFVNFLPFYMDYCFILLLINLINFLNLEKKIFGLFSYLTFLFYFSFHSFFFHILYFYFSGACLHSTILNIKKLFYWANSSSLQLFLDIIVQVTPIRDSSLTH